MTDEYGQQQQSYSDRLRDLLRRGIITQAIWETLNYCDIHVHLDESTDPYFFCLKVTFQNRSHESVHCSFPVRSSDYEVGLDIFDQSSGQSVMPRPQRQVFWSPRRRNEPAPPVIEAGGSLTYEITGWFDDKSKFRFAGSSYWLTRGHTYLIRFSYWGLASNTITWTVSKV